MLRNISLSASVITLALGACAKPQDASSGGASTTTPAAMAAAKVDTLATADIKDASGKSLGTVVISEKPTGIVVNGDIKGLPGGEYGVHLHSVGICEAPDFKTAGAHWNPTGKVHGISNAPAGPHAGDLPNLMMKPDSTGSIQGMTVGGHFMADSTGLMDKDGAAIVIHAGPDDYKTDPSGNSGARIACGVIVKK